MRQTLRGYKGISCSHLAIFSIEYGVDLFEGSDERGRYTRCWAMQQLSLPVSGKEKRISEFQFHILFDRPNGIISVIR